MRVIAATNKDFEHEVAEAKFREDLFYRLNVIPMLVPPLRGAQWRHSPVVHHFLQQHCQKKEIPLKTMGAHAPRDPPPL